MSVAYSLEYGSCVRQMSLHNEYSFLQLLSHSLWAPSNVFCIGSAMSLKCCTAFPFHLELSFYMLSLTAFGFSGAEPAGQPHRR